MPDQYESDESVNKYDTWNKKNLFKERIFKPTINRIFAKSLAEKRCIDLACGSGYSTQWLAQLNPGELIGVDLSESMIELAKKLLSNKAEFHVRDCSVPLGLGHFDVVFSAYLLNNAGTKELLDKMVHTMFDATKPGGLCVGIITSPFFRKQEHLGRSLTKHGLEFITIGDNKFRVRFFDGPVEEGRFIMEVQDCIWEPQAYTDCFEKVGFERFEWIKPQLGDEFEDKDGYFEDFLNITPYLFFKAIRPID